MCKNFLENIYKILVIIRFDIQNKNNEELLEIVSESIGEERNNADMVALVSEIMPEFKQQLALQNEENFRLSGEAKEFMLSALGIAKKALEEREYEFASEVIDMLHVFPHIVIGDEAKQVKEYGKIYVNPIIKKRKLKKERLFNVKKCRA